MLVSTSHLVLHLLSHLFLSEWRISIRIVRVWWIRFNIYIQRIWVLRYVSTKISVFLFLLTSVLCTLIVELFSVASGPDLLRLAPIRGPLWHLILSLRIVGIRLSWFRSLALLGGRCLKCVPLTMHGIGQRRVRSFIRVARRVQLLLCLVNLLHVIVLTLFLHLVLMQMHGLLLQWIMSEVACSPLYLVVVVILLSWHLLLGIHHFFFQILIESPLY